MSGHYHSSLLSVSIGNPKEGSFALERQVWDEENNTKVPQGTLWGGVSALCKLQGLDLQGRPHLSSNSTLIAQDELCYQEGFSAWQILQTKEKQLYQQSKSSFGQSA